MKKQLLTITMILLLILGSACSVQEKNLTEERAKNVVANESEVKEEIQEENKETGQMPALNFGDDYSSLTSGLVTAYYSDGYKALAEEQLTRVSNLYDYYSEVIGFSEDINIYILDREDVKRDLGEEVPYGMPFVLPRAYTNKTSSIVMPATDDGSVTMAGLQYLDNLPEESKMYFELSGYSPEEAIKKYTDLVITHEFGHLVLGHLDLVSQGHWINESLANYVAISYLDQFEPENVNIWYGGMYLAYANGGQPLYTTVDEFEAKYMEMDTENYVWYQTQFSLTVKEAYETLGSDFLLQVAETLGGQTIDSTSETIDLLNTISPVFKERWIEK